MPMKGNAVKLGDKEEKRGQWHEILNQIGERSKENGPHVMGFMK